jgi:hypothetical protein
MTFSRMAAVAGAVVCTGGCGLSWWRHDRGVLDPFGVIHYAERRFSRRSARHFLMLCAEAERRTDIAFLNSPDYDFWYVYHDNVRAQEWAKQLGFRLPSHLSTIDRLYCTVLANRRGIHLARDYPTVYAWARSA